MADTPGGRLRILREAVGVSQEELAAKMDVRQATLSNWETEKTSPDRGYLRLAADLVKDGSRIYRWLLNGGRTPTIVPISNPEPSEIERLYSRAVMEVGAASGREGLVPLPLVATWLSRLRDAAIGTDEPMPSTEAEPVPAAGGGAGHG